MKGKHNSAILYLLFLILLSFAIRPALAKERDFPAGSLIVPMDTFYQPGDYGSTPHDGGILEAYGLVYTILSHTDIYGDPDITVYWVIDDNKTSIDAPDVIIKVLDANATPDGVVIKKYEHPGGTLSKLTAYDTADNDTKVSFAGGVFIVDAKDVPKVKTILDDPAWNDVEVYQAEVPFKAPVRREMIGTPPRIALLDSSETGGNAKILESYLKLAGICPDNYDILTPNDVRDGALNSGDYDFLWAPHWTGYDTYNVDADGDGIKDVEEIVKEVAEFLKNGKGLLAECASIEVFEHSENGRFLTTNDLGHNGGTNDPATIIYNDVSAPYSQIGDFYFSPEGGHLHNWRPYQPGDNNSFFGTNSTKTSQYRDTVTRFTIDNTGWDYYVGGYAYGNKDNGYVVYLGGHKYADCGASTPGNIKWFSFEFINNIGGGNYTLVFEYTEGVNGTAHAATIKIKKGANIGGKKYAVVLLSSSDASSPVDVDVTSAWFENKKIRGIQLTNYGTTDAIMTQISISAEGEGGQKLKKVEVSPQSDLKGASKLWEDKKGKVLPQSFDPDSEADIAFVSSSGSACVDNSGCKVMNIAGVRYVLNTLFNIKYAIKNHEYNRSAPIVAHPYVYQGSFEYPSYRGHFRKFEVTANSTFSVDHAVWDAADRIPAAGDGNAAPGARKVYTVNATTKTLIDFDSAHIDLLRDSMNATGVYGDDDDVVRVIERIRGRRWSNKTSSWHEVANKLGGIIHSAPVIVSPNSRVGSSREEVAYVGDAYGILHAFSTSTGVEKWAFIPSNLLSRLHNDRTDPNDTDFPAVDASPTVKDVYYDQDGDNASEWRTILTDAEGTGGYYIFALDITDPDNFQVLWEATDDNASAPGGGMGYGFRTSINKIKWPFQDVNDTDSDGNTSEILHKIRWMVYVSTGFKHIVGNQGGIHVYAFDLSTGQMVWRWSEPYVDSVNDIPGAVTLADIDGDSFMDRVYVGDMDGRMWELDAITGQNVNGVDSDGKEIPLYNCGLGNPISVSPAIIGIGSHLLVVFGTGGTDWADDNATYGIYVVDAADKSANATAATGAGKLFWSMTLPKGQKVWSSPTIAAGQLFVATASGKMESADVRDDLVGTGTLYNLSLLEGTENWSLDVGKVRGSLFVDRQHVYISTIDNNLIQVGNDDFSPGNANNVKIQSWKQLW